MATASYCGFWVKRRSSDELFTERRGAATLKLMYDMRRKHMESESWGADVTLPLVKMRGGMEKPRGDGALFCDLFFGSGSNFRKRKDYSKVTLLYGRRKRIIRADTDTRRRPLEPTGDLALLDQAEDPVAGDKLAAEVHKSKLSRVLFRQEEQLPYMSTATI
ncbi:hypothetical protein P389DRAFT_191078 [Cystobasidium minutum MCA 4210]|uniref:uncharacterized protein n=1 Tax=Cystobasidium minutum MCA 4210 TaxID=1397322 RepID=UPI0034CEBE49|eukprot:jgi/Rhomi1/191078/estExt_fgenesh1_pg.C_70052